VAERAYLTWRYDLLEPFGSGDPFAHGSQMKAGCINPLILTVRVEAAINLVRLSYLLFAFKREAPIALTLHHAIMQPRAQPCPSLCTNEGPRIFSLRIPFAQNIPKGTSALSGLPNGALTTTWRGSRALQPPARVYGQKGEAWSAG
jgi:hypothetical protein